MDKYRRFRPRRSLRAAHPAGAVETMIDAAGFEHGKWAAVTYRAADTLRSAILAGETWFPFSAEGLSVGPSVRPNLLRVDLIDQAARPHSYLVRDADLLTWIHGIALAVP